MPFNGRRAPSCSWPTVSLPPLLLPRRGSATLLTLCSDRPPDRSRRWHAHLSFTSLLVGLVILAAIPSLASAQQKQLRNNNDNYADSPVPRGKSTFWGKDDDTPSVSPLSPSVNSKSRRLIKANDVRALATLAPTGNLPDRRDRLVYRSSDPSAGLSSRRSARSLQDWKVEDLVLMATIDGSIHASDRKTGARRWVMQSEQPMVETVYHPRNKSAHGMPSASTDNFLWIVEPSQGGSLFGYIPDTSMGLQNLGLSVKQLAGEWSPYESDDPPIVYTGETKTTVYTVDVSTGKVLKMFSSGGSAVFDDTSCRTLNDLEALDDTEPLTGTMSLGRSEYKVDIASKTTGEPICTIRYFEWGPNNADADLINQYTNSKDNRYVYSLHDGNVIAQDYLSIDQGGFSNPQLLYRSKFPAPVVRVFDLARRKNDASTAPPFVILPQPGVPPVVDSTQDYDRIFVNRTEAGSWYAMSEARYPAVTDGAPPALCTLKEWQEYIREINDDGASFKKGLIGVHGLDASQDLPNDVPRIGAPDQVPGLPPGYEIIPDDNATDDSSDAWKSSPFLWAILCIVPAIMYLVPKHGFRLASALPTPIQTQIGRNVPEVVVEDLPTPGPTEVAADAIAKSVKFEGPITTDQEGTVAPQGDQVVVNGSGEDGTPTSKKKKAHRGKRGGRKDKNKSEEGREEDDAAVTAVDGVQQEGKDTVVKPDVVSKAVIDEVGTKGLDNLRIHTDRVLGNGSGGTFVFEGEFEGRSVAVKRMLPQYYELASQEVSLLQNSEEHPNVIRYFCRREDQHFLYIALELCQASLYDLFKDGRLDEAPDSKFSPLSEQVRSDPKRILRQIAEGVKYLHDFRIVHRDIKPQNMLIAYPKKNTMSAFPRLVISDFGLCKTLPENVSTLVGTTGHAGTAGWKAPELIFQPKEMLNGSQQSTARSENGDSTSGANAAAGVKRAVDIFSLGCVFFYILSEGCHPFDDDEGWMQLRERNIKIGRMNMKPIAMFGRDTLDLVQWMLAGRPEERPTAQQVLAHPFFWDAEDRLEFLSAASDRFDQEPRDGTSEVLEEVESHADEIIELKTVATAAHVTAAMHGHLRSNAGGGHYPSSTMSLPIPELNFLAKLDKRFVETVGRQRKYDPSKVCDLLRALRNKHHHWDDMPPDVKDRVGPVPEGYLAYWEKHFPELVVKVWRAVVDLGLSKERRFARWFVNKGVRVGDM